MVDKKAAEEIAELKREVAELKAKVSPPESTFKPAPYQQYDPTAGMTMPASTLREMVRAVPDHMLRDIVRDNRAPTGRPGMIPDAQYPTSPRPSAGDGTGWAREIPLGPSMHQRYVEQQIDAQDANDKAERVQQAAQAETARKFVEQSEKLDRLIERVAEQNKKLTEPSK
jgi:hypothetical protein